jgi:hypothetical protein
MNLSPSRTSTLLRMRRYSRRRRWLLSPDFAKGLGVRKRAAVEDGEFEVVELDVDVVDAGAEQCGEQVFRGGDEDALTHEAGGVADLGDVAADGGDFESVEIGAAEDHAGARGRGEQGACAQERRCEGQCRRTQLGRKSYFPGGMIQPSVFLGEDYRLQLTWESCSVVKTAHWSLKSHSIGKDYLYGNQHKKSHLWS